MWKFRPRPASERRDGWLTRPFEMPRVQPIPLTTMSSDSDSESGPPLPMESESRLVVSKEPDRSACGAKKARARGIKLPKTANKFKTRKGVMKEAEKDDELNRRLAHLPEKEREILRRQLEIPPVTATFGMLYRYASRNDTLIIVVSIVCAIAAGAATPLMTLIFGQLAGSFQAFFNGQENLDGFKADLGRYALDFVYLAIAEFVTIYISTLGFVYTGEHITARIREEYLAALLRQNMGFFDQLGAGEMTTRITSDTNLVQDGMSEKVALAITSLATFVTAFVIGFAKYWKLTLILTSGVAGTFVVMTLSSGFFIKSQMQAILATGVGASVAEEVLSSIRNAVAFGTQEKLAQRFQKHLIDAEKWGVKTKVYLNLMFGAMVCVSYLTYGLSVWMGSRYIVDGETDLSSVLTILMALTIGAFMLGSVAPNVQAMATGIAAAGKIFQTIDRQSPLDPWEKEGNWLEWVEGNIELCGIKHIYPSRPDVVVLNKVSLSIPAGKTTALVGASGSGKSSIISCIERFYEPVEGRLLLDGFDISTLNLEWWRQQVSLVSQEPVLFATTIYKNIAHGLINSEFEFAPNRHELVARAAQMANAHDFIMKLPEGYETNVGDRGSLLSGGQKQRIAIARAIVRNPKILLLDEATSALDTKSEGVVQQALDVAARGRTTLVIAHRLSTIKNADNIIVMAHGRVVEQGTHDYLLASRGAYYELVQAQKFAERAEDSNSSDEYSADLAPVKTSSVRSHHSPVESPSRKAATVMFVPVAGDCEEKQYSTGALIRLMMSLNRQEWAVMLVGVVFAVISGGGTPVQAVFFAEAISALSLPPDMYDELRRRANFWALMYLMLAFAVLVAFILNSWAFAHAAERLVHRARDRAFRAFLRQDVSFFDKEENSTGALTAFLSAETNHLAGISGSTLGTILNLVTTLVASLSIALVIGWKLALVCAATIPVLLACGFLRFAVINSLAGRSKKAYADSATYACEATSAIKTVASLTREKDVWRRYRSMLSQQQKKSIVSAAKSSILFALSQSLTFCAIALGFWYGGTLLAAGEYSLFQFYVCFGSIIFGAQAAGVVFSFTPDFAKAKQAANALKNLFDRRPRIDTWSRQGTQNSRLQGKIEFRDVHFHYPTRPDHPVLRGLNLTVYPGQYVALVGPSGCGKTSTIQLLERFYDPTSGAVLVDSKNIAGMNVSNYRGFLSLVSQEPTLYHGSIRDNLLLGVTVGSLPDEQIERALCDANIHEFVSSLPEGLDTVVGPKGGMLSGGQKQRIAIARALLRDPQILLLDEATSALDSESEKLVQRALDRAARGRTTIAVAHRLSSIQKADVIYFMDGGRVVERGTHAELMALRGNYCGFVKMQSLSRSG